MAIYARCTKCRRDDTASSRICKACGAKLGSKYLVRVKDNSTSKWRTKITPSLKLAKEVEIKFKIQKIERELFNKKEKNQFNFNLYLKHAKLVKKSWKSDRSMWDKHISNKNHNSKQGIQSILTTNNHLSPQTRNETGEGKRIGYWKVTF